eukprot:SAG11_NODE_2654_length_3123_cov_9.811177_1_plen_320_part_00
MFGNLTLINSFYPRCQRFLASQFSLAQMAVYDQLFSTCTRALPTEPLLRALVVCSANPPDLCFDVDCGEHASCDGGTCQCEEGYSGESCEVFDPCADVDCGGHGQCAGGRCQCEAGYSGGSCEVLLPTQYVIGALNTYECAIGTQRIATEADCRAAAQANGAERVTVIDDTRDMPGCEYESSGNQMFFNTDPSPSFSNGDHPRYAPVCKGYEASEAHQMSWTHTPEKYCSGNLAVDHVRPYRYGVTIEECKDECLGTPSCYGIAVTTDGSQQCIKCTGDDRTLSTGDRHWDYYAKDGAQSEVHLPCCTSPCPAGCCRCA